MLGRPVPKPSEVKSYATIRLLGRQRNAFINDLTNSYLTSSPPYRPSPLARAVISILARTALYLLNCLSWPLLLGRLVAPYS